MTPRNDPIIVMAACGKCGSKRWFDHGDASFTCANKACGEERFQ